MIDDDDVVFGRKRTWWSSPMVQMAVRRRKHYHHRSWSPFFSRARAHVKNKNVCEEFKNTKRESFCVSPTYILHKKTMRREKAEMNTRGWRR